MSDDDDASDSESSNVSGPNVRTRPSDFNLRRRHERTDPDPDAPDDSDLEQDPPSDESESDADEHEDACAVCKESSRPEKLLCCDSCPRVCHLDCLDPPLDRVPKGKWSCPRCKEIWRMQLVERIYDEKGEGMDAMYYVKWKGRSHRHCSWVSKPLFMEARRIFSYLHTKIRAFETHEQEDIELEAYDQTEFVNGVHKNWLTVEKVLDANNDSFTSVLVKWKDLPYDDCTWEAISDIEDATDAVNTFKLQTSIRHEARNRRRAQRLSDNAVNDSSGEAAAAQEDAKYTSTPSFLREGCQLHPYQLEGLNWLKFKWDHNQNVILADEMGLGKTIQAIAFLTALWDECVYLPHLVVVPLSTMQNWQREFETWAPQLKVVAVHGSKDARQIILNHEIYLSKNTKKSKKRRSNKTEDMNRRIKCHVILTSYEVVSLESAKLGKIEYECMIVDEGHRLKGRSSKLVKELNNFVCHHRILLTGTPLQNNIQELFALLHFIEARKFDNWESFEADFADISEEEQVKKLHGLLTPHLLRRLKKDVLKNLPPKKEQIVRVEMTNFQREMYKSILGKNLHLLITDKKNQEARRGLLSVVTQLRKCCGHPYLFEGVENMNLAKQEELQEMIEMSGKLKLLDEMLLRLKAQGHRVLIYSQFVIMLNILEDYLQLRGYGFLRIDGKINGSERQPLIDAFNQEQDKYFVFLLSTRAGGLGINLATADTVILYDSDYNPHNDIQAQARAHRLGQEKPVMIYRLVTRLTIEERMMQLAKEKLVLEQIVVRKMGKTELKQDELDGILRYGAEELFADERLVEHRGKGLSVTDQESARFLADQSSARIVYDDEALDKLLDRSDMTTAEEDKMEVDNGELLESFKIANFEVAQQSNINEKQKLTWQELLLHRKDAQEALTKHKSDPDIITPGRRRRRNEVVYRLDDPGSDDESMDSEYKADGQEAEDSESTDLEADLDIPTESLNQPRATVQEGSVDQVSIIRTRPKRKSLFASWNGEELLILGFTPRERQVFVNVLLRFGFPEGALDGSGDVDWTEFTSRLPRKKHQYVDDYARLLFATASGDVPPEVQAKDLLFDNKPDDLLTKIGQMYLFRKKLQGVGRCPGKLWTGRHPPAVLYSTRFWGEAHDWALIRAVVKFGNGRWKDFLLHGENDIEAVLHRELGLEMSAGEAAIDLSGPPETGDLEGLSLDIGKSQKEQEESEAVKRSRLRSIETKCRNWMINRLKLLVEQISAEQAAPEQEPAQPAYHITPQLPSATSLTPGSLRWKYQAMVRQCFAVRQCAHRVTGQQSYQELQDAGTQFRTQMKELGILAHNLGESLVDDHGVFLQREKDLKSSTVSHSWNAAPPISGGVRLASTLGTSVTLPRSITSATTMAARIEPLTKNADPKAQ